MHDFPLPPGFACTGVVADLFGLTMEDGLQ